MTGKIDSVVKKRGCNNGQLHFKLVDSNNECLFELCKVVMSTSKQNLYKVNNWTCFPSIHYINKIIQVFKENKTKKQVLRIPRRTWTNIDHNGVDIGQHPKVF